MQMIEDQVVKAYGFVSRLFGVLKENFHPAQAAGLSAQKRAFLTFARFLKKNPDHG